MGSGIPFNVGSPIGGFKMKEGISGGSRRPRGGNLPSDAKLWEELNSREMYISKQNQTLTIETSEYHPGLLCLTKKDLHVIIKAMSK
jgi:hypothetical protein